MTIIYFGVLTFLSLFIGNTHTCVNNRRLLVTVKDTSETWSNVTVSGCLKNTSFPGKTVVRLDIADQSITSIEPNFITDLPDLESINIINCGIESIAPGSFVDLEELQNVEISHNELTIVDTGVFTNFDNLHTLKLNQNLIQNITLGAFPRSLEEVDFSSNDLEEYKPEWFDNTPYIEKIYFENNNIRKLPENAFGNLQGLKYINFDHNRLVDIGNKAFSKLKSVRLLTLRNNRIGFINQNIFPRSIKIDTLDLSGNYIVTIGNDVFKKLTIKTIIVDYNPYLCSCKQNLLKWLNLINGTLQEADNCGIQLPDCVGSIDGKCPQSRSDDLEEDESSYYQTILKFLRIINEVPEDQKRCAGLLDRN